MESAMESSAVGPLRPSPSGPGCLFPRCLAVLSLAFVLSCDARDVNVGDRSAETAPTPAPVTETQHAGDVDDVSSPDVLSPSERAPAKGRPGSRVRTGARRVGVLHREDHYVTYEARSDLELPRLDEAIADRSFGFAVERLEELTTRQIDNGFHIQRAGEIVANGIALQLEEMGYSVQVEASVESIADDERLPEAVKMLLARFGGKVEFWVLHGLTGDGDREDGDSEDGDSEDGDSEESDERTYETRSRLRVDLDVRGDRLGADPRPIHTLRIEDEERILGDKLAESAVRARKAAGAVLRRVVASVVQQPELEAALVEFVRGEGE